MAVLTHAERITEIRFLLGDPSTTVISDTVIDRFLTRQEDDYGTALEEQCVVLYNTCLDCITYLTNKAVSGSGSGATVSGGITKRREKIGQAEVEEMYSSSSKTNVSTWNDLYKYFKKHPEYVCKSLRKPVTSLVVLGGVSQAEKDRVYTDPDSFGNGYAENQQARDNDINTYLEQATDPYYYPKLDTEID